MDMLICGHIVKIDEEDARRVMDKRWYVQAERAASGAISYRVYDTTRLKTPMTRFILGAEKSPGVYIDHINGDKLDNRKSNLRVVTNSQNQMNRKVSITNKLGLKGVRLIPSSGRYQASITKDGKLHTLGYFDSPRSAAIAYDNAAREMFGKFALLNLPDVFEPTPVEAYATATGEKWIQIRKLKYMVAIKATKWMPGYHSKGFTYLLEAVDHRDRFVMLSGELVKDGRHYSYKTLPEDIRNKLYKENP